MCEKHKNKPDITIKDVSQILSDKRLCYWCELEKRTRELEKINQ